MEKQLRFVIFLLLCLMSSFVMGVNPPSAPAENTIDYAKASSVLEKQVSSGVRNAELFNQLGLSYYHQGKTGMAIVCFLRSLRLNSADKNARNNLEFAINHSRDQELYPETSFLFSFFSRLFNSLNLDLLACIVLFLLILLSVCLHWLLHLSYNADRAIPVMWVLIFSLVFLIFSTLLILKYQNYSDNKQAVVIASETGGYSGPGSEYSKTFTVHDGLILQINRIDKDWALVSLPNGSAGWVETTVLEKVVLK